MYTKVWLLQFLVSFSFGQDTNTNARDYCWQFTTESECTANGGQEIPTSILPGNPTVTGDAPICRWVNINYINGCDYTNTTNVIPVDPSDTSVSCSSNDPRPSNAPMAVCVPDDCALYENDTASCEESSLCEWVMNDMTLFSGGRCMNKCFNKVDVMITLDGSQSRAGEVATNLENTALFYEQLPNDEIDPQLWLVREYFILWTGPNDINFRIDSPGTQVVPFSFNNNGGFNTPQEKANEVRRYKNDSIFFPQGTTPLRFNIFNSSQRFKEETLGDYERFYILISDGIGNLFYNVNQEGLINASSETCDLREPFLTPLDVRVIGFVPEVGALGTENVNCLTIDGDVNIPTNSGPNDLFVFGDNAFPMIRMQIRNIDQSVCYMRPETDSPSMTTRNPSRFNTMNPTRAPTRLNDKDRYWKWDNSRRNPSRDDSRRDSSVGRESQEEGERRDDEDEEERGEQDEGRGGQESRESEEDREGEESRNDQEEGRRDEDESEDERGEQEGRNDQEESNRNEQEEGGRDDEQGGRNDQEESNRNDQEEQSGRRDEDESRGNQEEGEGKQQDESRGGNQGRRNYN